jgi:hypothetical protein
MWDTADIAAFSGSLQRVSKHAADYAVAAPMRRSQRQSAVRFARVTISGLKRNYGMNQQDREQLTVVITMLEELEEVSPREVFIIKGRTQGSVKGRIRNVRQVLEKMIRGEEEAETAPA